MQRNSLHFQKIAHKKIEMIKMMIIISELSLKLKKFFGFTLIIIVERTEDRNSDTINFIFSTLSIITGNHDSGRKK